MKDQSQKFIDTISNPLKFRLFLISRLPAAFYSGLKLRSMNKDHCSITVPFKRFTKNPFRSTYFACLAMGAEMSTGALAMAYLYKRKPGISMLVTGLEAVYYKRATGLTTFICNEGWRFREAIEQAIDTGEPVTITAESNGYNEAGDLISAFWIKWSFKSRS